MAAFGELLKLIDGLTKLSIAAGGMTGGGAAAERLAGGGKAAVVLEGVGSSNARDYSARLRRPGNPAEDPSFKPVSQDIRGLSWAERLERLQAAGALLPKEIVQGRVFGRNPTPRQMVVESEREQQRQRERDWQERQNLPPLPTLAAAGGSAAARTPIGASLGMAASNMAAVGYMADKAVVWLNNFAQATERSTREFLESRRNLREFNAVIANTFARLDYQDRVLAMRTAGATSGSTSVLGDSYRKLRDELQPLREAGTTAKNLMATGAVQLARLATVAVRLVTVGTGIEWVLKQIERVWGAGQDPRSELLKHLEKLAGGNWEGAKNRQPIVFHDAEEVRRFRGGR